MKNKALYGLVSGIMLVVATLIGVALLNTPSVGRAASSPVDGKGSACQHATQDQGYGVSRRAPDCSAADWSPTPPADRTGRL